jgi:hypothetical protein
LVQCRSHDGQTHTNRTVTMKGPLNARAPRATTGQKALEFNLDPLLYGSLAEIGAGQEVARHFFRAGGASGTIAKTTSAYDMRFSDAIYGSDATGRYVTRDRLLRMLDHEFGLIIERVADNRPPDSRYFVFADTVAARRFGAESEDHGWLGLQFQHMPGAAPSRVVIHVGMFDATNQDQQEALGVLGVNLIDAAFRHHDDTDRLMESLIENLAWGRVEIDGVELDGPAFEGVDRRAIGLRVVSSSLGPVVIFGPDGCVTLPADLLYKKVPLLLRGSFRPFTNVHADMITRGKAALAAELDIAPADIVVLCEMNIARHLYEGVDEVSDLQARVEMINELGLHAMVTSHLRFFRLAEHFHRHALRRIAFVLSVADLDVIFNDAYYQGLDGGMLQAMARLFSSDSKLLAYPNLNVAGTVRTAGSYELPETHAHLYRHLVANRRILGLEAGSGTLVPFAPDALGVQIAAGDPGWKELVPPSVQARIGELKL